MGDFLVYSIVFGLSTFFLTKGFNRKRKLNGSAYLGLFFLILFAAGRYHVGTDTGVYVNTFERYCIIPWDIFLKNVNLETLYAFCAKLTYSIGGRALTFGFFAALTIVPIYLTMVREYPEASLETAMICFLFFSYAVSFNIMRQYVAIAIVVWAIKYIFEDKLVQYVGSIIIAMGFHQSAVIALLFWFLWDHRRHHTIDGKKRILLILVTAIIVMNYVRVIIFLTREGSFLETYDDYLGKSAGANRDFFLYLAEFVVLMQFRKQLERLDERNQFALTVLIISVIVGFTGFTNPQIKRIGLYFSVPAKLLLFGYLPRCFSRGSDKAIKVLIILYAMLEFYLVAVLMKQGNLVPYHFDLFSPW